MIATFDSEPGLVVITLGDGPTAVESIDPHPRAIVAIDAFGNTVQVEISAIADGVEEPLCAVAEHAHNSGRQVDLNLLLAAAGAAVAAPDQIVSVWFGQDAV
ncbi:MAG: hypothetical protein HY827_04975 [Actinobacteria bacterium]|nr:hypothetical protein [Actinomycetota bacterium]